MGRVLANGLELMGTGRTMRLDNTLCRTIYEMAILAHKQDEDLTDNEKRHVKAVRLWAEGYDNENIIYCIITLLPAKSDSHVML